mmetsp:Transcript_6753/g.16414  ORF Transcript_6753/g.16414 Transcript_6753/m.16414 type:complete len:210 (-) Transcript_6753:29-658(-)
MCDASADLVHVQLDQHHRQHALLPRVALHHPIHRLRNVFHDDVEVGSLLAVAACALLLGRYGGVVEVTQLDHIRVPQQLHDVQLAILVSRVLQHLFDGDGLLGLHNLRQRHATERPGAQRLAQRIGLRPSHHQGRGGSLRTRRLHLCHQCVRPPYPPYLSLRLLLRSLPPLAKAAHHGNEVRRLTYARVQESSVMWPQQHSPSSHSCVE